jgi:hypothetical protein
VPSHQFLRLLLWYYSLELYHLTPSGILHIAAFITLCEAYLGIDPNHDLWMYFFRVCHPQDPEAELMIFGAIVIHVCHTWFLCENQVLIVCMTQDQLFHTYCQK